ncbi:hypothetical protein CB0940_02313 [Cercospora beticola]|nr:hypothetical protein CB0940_02313 [Cercospora beticola]PIA99629.1 hypothetical protein CB0940_02313 [Cercospora beticola]
MLRADRIKQQMKGQVCQTCGKSGHSSEQHAAIPSPNATTTIQTLPAELRLEILSSLPAKDIQRCRGVSKDFRNVVDVQQNSLLKAVRGRYDGLEDAHYFVGSVEEPSLLRFLFFHLSRRGIWCYPAHTRYFLIQATRQWCANWSPTIRALVSYLDLEADADYPFALFEKLDGVVEGIVQAYIDTHCPELFTGRHNGEDYQFQDVSTPEKFLAIFDNTEHDTSLIDEAEYYGLPLDREEFRQWYIDIKDRKEPRIPSYPPSAKDKTGNHGLLHVPRLGDPCLQIPDFVLTRLQIINSQNYRVPREFIFEYKELGEVLGENIPDLGMDGAYCVRSKWAFDLLLSAKKGRVLAPCQKVAVLEDLCVF